MPDDHSICEPPDPIPNSEVKPNSADGSVGFPHVRVGHRQASIFSYLKMIFKKAAIRGFFFASNLCFDPNPNPNLLLKK